MSKRRWGADTPLDEAMAYEEQLLRTHKRKCPDHLTDLPPQNYRYVDAKGDTAFDTSRFRTQNTREAIHPKVIEKRRRRRADSAYEQYYQHMPKDHNIPLAGKPSAKLALIEAEEALSVRNDSGKRASTENDASSALLSPPLSAISPGVIKLPSPEYPSKGEREGSFPPTPEKEDAFQNRPSIKLVMPDHLKAMLVDDWENITKSQQLVPLPHPHPFDEVVKEYMDWEIPHRPEDSAEKDLLEETMAGLREYFNRALGRILLYKFVARKLIQTSQPPMSLPELVAQTNMDQQSVNRLREEITKFTNWLGKNYTKYFVSEYETPGPDYIEKSRSA
uniref:Histone acetylase complex subunit n=1 Tax=Pyricularia oryzae (strain P131) TaxID=1143193 RepID=L7JLU7_PYRO1